MSNHNTDPPQYLKELGILDYVKEYNNNDTRDTTSTTKNCIHLGWSNPTTTTPAAAVAPERRLQKLNYHSAPKLKWMAQLDEDDSLFHGNSIVQSPVDEDVLYLTTHSGSLLALSAKDGTVLNSIRPTPRSITQSSKTVQWSLYSTSGISFGVRANGKPFLIYSVVDVPPIDEDTYGGPKT